MPAIRLSTETTEKRKVRSHRKSRQGCGNCKLRKVKCDETRPKCQKCMSYGVFCNYDSRQSDLELSADGILNIDISPRWPSPTAMVPSTKYQASKNPYNTGDFYEVRGTDVDLLARFQLRTIPTLSTLEDIVLYRDVFVRLAFSNSFLMHTVLAVSLLHERYLTGATDTDVPKSEAFHRQHGFAMFNSKLSGPIHPAERDALWAAAILMGIIAFCNLESKKPKEVWPLAPSSPLDLNWLRMSEGKSEVARIVQPMRVDCVFRHIAEAFHNSLPAKPGPIKPGSLPQDMIDLCDLDTNGTEQNPYFAAASNLALMLNFTEPCPVIAVFLGFISRTGLEFRTLLEQKDPRALLILSYWYARVSEYRHWWIWHRVILECQSICIYLEKERGCNDERWQRLLKYPKTITGMEMQGIGEEVVIPRIWT